MPAKRIPPHRPLLLFICLLSHILRATASLINVTIDDAAPLVTYAPPLKWANQDCTGCEAKADLNQAFDRTWHDTTFPAGGSEADLRMASLIFSGSAIYVYCIIDHTLAAPNSTSDLVFLMDGEPVGEFVLVPSGAVNFDYNVPVYSNSSFPYGLHNFTLQVGRIGGWSSLVLLDYFVYTMQDNDASPGLASLPATSSSSASSAYTSSSACTSSTQSSLASTFAPSSTSISATSLLSHTKTIVIATTFANTVVMLSIIAALTLFCIRRNRQTMRHHLHPSGRYITQNPMTFERAENTWMFGDSPMHPTESLALTRDDIDEQATRERSIITGSTTAVV